MVMNKAQSVSPRLLTCIVTIVLLSGSTIAAHATSSLGLIGCDRKICEKEYELKKAKQYGDVKKILGLQNSLVHIEDQCAQGSKLNREEYSDDLHELKSEYKDDLDDTFDEYRDDLKEAKSEGKSDKVRRAKEKYELKVERVTTEYNHKLELLQAKSRVDTN